MFLDDGVLQSRSTNSIVYARQGGPGDIPLDKSELVAIFLEALIYGVEALTFVATVYLLHGANRNKSLFVKFSSVIIMFLLNTIHIGTSLRRILNAFIGTNDEPIPDAAGYLADIAGFLYRFKNILIVIQTIMLDILVAYRCYMVWDRKIWVAFIPSPSIIAYFVTGIAAIHAFAVFKNDTIFTGFPKTWVSATICITLLTKITCLTIVILATYLPRPKSSWHTSYLRVNQHPKLHKAVLVVIESGGLAGIGALILVPVYLAGRNAQSVLWGAMSPLTGESFLLIMTASLLGMTPSSTGASRRRKGAIPNNRFTLPPISISPVSRPTSRFSVGNSLLKSSMSASGSPHSDSDKAKPPVTQAEEAFRNSRGYLRGEAVPFSTAVVAKRADSREISIHDALAYGDGKAKRKEPIEDVDLRRKSGEHGVDGSVEVLQKEHVTS